MKDYYQILEISETASKEEIKKSYKNLVKKYHPDLHMGKEHDFFEIRMKQLNEAYNILTNPEKRQMYDNELLAEKEKSTKPEIKDTNTKGYNPKNDKTLKIIIVLFLILSLIIMTGICYGIYYYFFASNKYNSPNHLDFGLSKSEVITLLGEPIGKTSHLMVYNGYQIIINNGTVDGWLDASGSLNVGHQEDTSINDFKVGDNMLNIIRTYGNPDTYSKELAIYNNVVLYLKDSVVTKIEEIS